ncbi:MAG TPA: enolase C-terminal domain-like protein [Polyangiaceae bacterium]
MRARRIISLSFEPWNVELLEPFGIATGAQLVAENVLLELRLEGGALGLGEAAPFPAVNAETQADALAALEGAREALLSAELDPAAGSLPEPLQALLAAAPSALCALEMALLDAACRERQVSMFRHFGGRQPQLSTDITITTGSAEAAAAAARRALTQGFATLKVKVGGDAFENDLERLRRIAEQAPRARLLLDANASLSAEAAVALVDGLGARRAQVVLFEQPCARGDFAGARRVRQAGIRVAADEDARSTADVTRLATEQAADVVNFKLTKCGVSETLRMIAEAQRLGLGLMMGGMVETRLAMTVSACIAGGIGGFEELDLDTPLFMRDDRLLGGFAQVGATLDVGAIVAGHGVCRRATSAA